MRELRSVPIEALLDIAAIEFYKLPGIVGTPLAEYREEKWIPHYVKFVQHRFVEELTCKLKEGETSVYDTMTTSDTTEDECFRWLDHNGKELEKVKQAMISDRVPKGEIRKVSPGSASLPTTFSNASTSNQKSIAITVKSNWDPYVCLSSTNKLSAVIKKSAWTDTSSDQKSSDVTMKSVDLNTSTDTGSTALDTSYCDTSDTTTEMLEDEVLVNKQLRTENKKQQIEIRHLRILLHDDADDDDHSDETMLNNDEANDELVNNNDNVEDGDLFEDTYSPDHVEFFFAY